MSIAAALFFEAVHPMLVAVRAFDQPFGAEVNIEVLPMNSASGADEFEVCNKVPIGTGQVLEGFDRMATR